MHRNSGIVASSQSRSCAPYTQRMPVMYKGAGKVHSSVQNGSHSTALSPTADIKCLQQQLYSAPELVYCRRQAILTCGTHCRKQALPRMCHAPCVMRQALGDMRLAACVMRHATCVMRLATCSDDLLPRCNTPHATCSMQHATSDKQHATCSVQHATCNMQHAACYQEPYKRGHW